MELLTSVVEHKQIILIIKNIIRNTNVIVCGKKCYQISVTKAALPATCATKDYKGGAGAVFLSFKAE